MGRDDHMPGHGRFFCSRIDRKRFYNPHMKLILASASPRRAQLLSEANIPFDIHPSHVDESFDPSIAPDENARIVAIRKGEEIAIKFPRQPVLAADTIVVLEEKVIGKPVDENDAVRMLMNLSGREHIVYTGVALIDNSRSVNWSHVEKSSVFFKKVDRLSIQRYVATGEPMDKAGAYAIQGGAKGWIERFEGSKTNIIGLPMEPVMAAFKTFGYDFGKAGAIPWR